MATKTMNLREMLNEAVEGVEGAYAIGLVGLDGLGVEMVNADPDNSDDTEANEEMAVQMASLMAAVTKGASYLGGGKIKDLIVEAQDRTFLASMVDKEYFLVLVLNAEASMGRGRFEMRHIINKVRREI